MRWIGTTWATAGLAMALIAGGAVSAQPAPGGTIALAGPARAEAIARAAAQAKRQGWRKIMATPAQSFRITRSGREVATLVTGEATFASGVPGCFAAIVQGDRVALVPTVGTGDYETTSCGKPVAAGLLSPREPVTIGVLFAAYSPNAEGIEPVALRWRASDGTLTIDAAGSRRASLAGAQTIAQMRRAIR